MGLVREVAFGNDSGNWTERFDLIEIAAAAFARHGHELIRHADWLEHRESGFVLQVQRVEVQPYAEGGVRTTTTVQVNHPVLVPGGLFEFQHARGENVADALRHGFDQWVQADFVPLLEMAGGPQACPRMEGEVAATPSRPAHTRRVLFGPTIHYRSAPPTVDGSGPDDDHDFCPCCLFTRSFAAFDEAWKAGDVRGLRLFAMRDVDGRVDADCRVNGLAWEPGVAALKAYAQTWPDTGYEYRKQYVVIHSVITG